MPTTFKQQLATETKPTEQPTATMVAVHTQDSDGNWVIGYVDILTYAAVTDEVRATVHTSASLNAEHPTTPIFFKVYCTNIAVRIEYTKVTATEWIAVPINVI